jgi:hypothetical protein
LININSTCSSSSIISNFRNKTNKIVIKQKPSKIPKYQRNTNKNASNSSNVNSSISSATSSTNELFASNSILKVKYLSSNSKIPQRQPVTHCQPQQQQHDTTTPATVLTLTPTTTTISAINPKTLINSNTFISKKNSNNIQQEKVIKDEGYSTMSNELVNHICLNNSSNTNNNAVTLSCEATTNKSSCIVTNQAWVCVFIEMSFNKWAKLSFLVIF